MRPGRVGAAVRSWRLPVHRDGAALVASSALSSGVGLLYWVAAARLFPPAEVGVGSATVAALMLLGGIGQLNLGVALLRFLPVAGPSARTLVFRCYAVGASVAALVGTGFAAGAGWWAPDLSAGSGSPGPVVLLGIAAPVWAVYVMQDHVLTALGRAVVVPLVNLVFAVAKLVFLGAAAWWGWTAGIAVSWTAATALVVAGVTGWLALRLLPRPTADATAGAAAGRVTARAVVRFAGADQVGNLFWTAAVFGLPVVVLARLGPDGAATYGVAWTISYALFLVVQGMGQSLVAHLATTPGGPVAAARRAMTTRALTLLVPAVVVVVAGAGPLLSVFGPHYAATGVGVLVLTALAAVPDVVVRAEVSVARVQQRVAVLAGLPALVAVGVVATAWLLMPQLGLPGVGVAWLGVECAVAGAILLGRRVGTGGWRRRPGPPGRAVRTPQSLIASRPRCTSRGSAGWTTDVSLSS